MNLRDLEADLQYSDYYQLLFISLTVGLGSILRVHTIGFDSFWLDEAITMYFIHTMSYQEIITELPKVQPHLPLYYILLKAWTSISGTEEGTVRMLSAAFSIASIPVLYALGKRLYGFQVAAIAALMLTVSPFQIYFAQEARMYSLLAFLTVASYYCLLRYLTSKQTKEMALFIISAILLAYTHVFGFFVITSQLLYLFWGEWIGTENWRSCIREAGRIAIPVGIGAAPAVGMIAAKVFIPHSYGSGSQVQHIPAPPNWHDIISAYTHFTVRYSHPPMSIAVQVGLLIGIGGALFVPSHFLSRKKSVFLWSWLLIPTGLAVVLSYLIQPIFFPKYLIGCSVALYLLFARGAAFIPRPNVRTVLLAIILLNAVALNSFQFTDHQKREFESAAKFVDQGYSPDDLIIVDKRKSSSPFGYYFDRAGMPTAGDITGPLRPEIRKQVRSVDTVWVVFSSSKQPHRRKVLRVVRRTHDRAAIKHFAGITAYRFVEDPKHPVRQKTQL
ncbi:glycosyltransferase family 39 protein [Haladaptatus sp. DYF46]|uniref:glycosyltransferase family 39 protein n=1 Tax=Haladaptatus sp. DYF46 TaxID=2886041 RepID=UPI001E3C896A|nr:glycosyltransferase family 39 protein [Haladaptatus sp. DYF46]